MKKNKKLIIGIVGVLVIAAIGIGSLLCLNGKKDNSPNWMNLYYDFIKKSNDETFDDYVSTFKSFDVQFVPRENGYPLMVLKFISKDDICKKGLIVLYIDKDDKVSFTMIVEENDEIDIKLLYDRKEKKYKWFAIMSTKDGKYTYTDIEKKIELQELIYDIGDYNKAKEDEEFVKKEEECYLKFTKEELKTSETVDTITSFEERFIALDEDMKLETIKVKDLKKINDYKKEISKVTNDYRETNDFVSETTKNYVNETNQKLEEKEIIIKQKAEEEAKRKAEEEAKKKAEAEAKQKAEEEAKKKTAEDAAKKKTSFKVGNYTMNYGTYKGSGGYQGYMDGATLVLNSNGTYTLTNNGRTSNGTFKSNGGYIDFDGGSWTYSPLGNNVLGEPAGAGYDEKFTYSGN